MFVIVGYWYFLLSECSNLSLKNNWYFLLSEWGNLSLKNNQLFYNCFI